MPCTLYLYKTDLSDLFFYQIKIFGKYLSNINDTLCKSFFLSKNGALACNFFKFHTKQREQHDSTRPMRFTHHAKYSSVAEK